MIPLVRGECAMLFALLSEGPVIVRKTRQKHSKQVYVPQMKNGCVYVGHTLSSPYQILTSSYQANRGDLRPVVSTSEDWVERWPGGTNLFVVEICRAIGRFHFVARVSTINSANAS